MELVWQMVILILVLSLSVFYSASMTVDAPPSTRDPRLWLKYRFIKRWALISTLGANLLVWGPVAYTAVPDLSDHPTFRAPSIDLATSNGAWRFQNFRTP